MAFSTIGVEFVTKGLGSSSNDIKSFANDLAGLGKQIDDMARKFANLSGTFAGVGRTKGSKAAFGANLSDLSNQLNLLGSSVQGKSKAWQDMATATGLANGQLQTTSKLTQTVSEGLGRSTYVAREQSRSWMLMVATGVLLRDAIRAVIRQFTEFIGHGIESIETFQRLRVGMKSMLTRELVNTGMDFQQALGMAVPKAKAMMDELMRYSIIAPYALESTVSIMRQAQAYGFNADQAMTFAKALQNVSAATGVGNEVMGRMAYNLAQIRLVGKVTQRDVRDLGNAAFDLMGFMRSLGKEFGIEINVLADFNKAIDEGRLTWNQFIKGFADYSARLGDATRELGRTLFGVKQRMTNIADILGIRLLEPAIQAIVNRVSDLQDSFLKLYESGYVQALGELIGEGVEKALQDLGKLIDGLRALGTVAGEAFKWGFNIMSHFAQGLASGVSLVMEVVAGLLKAIGVSFTTLPQEIAKRTGDLFYTQAREGGRPATAAAAVKPTIPVIPTSLGTKALAGLLSQFKAIDFTMLESLQTPLKTILAEDMDIYMGISETLIRAVSEISTKGRTSIDIVGQLMKVGGQYGGALATLAQRQLSLAVAGRAVEAQELKVAAAQEAVAAANKAVKESEDSLLQSQERIGTLHLQYLELRTGKASQDAIKAKQKELTMAYVERRFGLDQASSLQKQLKARQNELDIQEDILKPLQKALAVRKEDVGVQQDLLRQLTDSAATLKEALAQMTNLKVETTSDFSVTPASLANARIEIQKMLDGIFNQKEGFSIKIGDLSITPKLAEDIGFVTGALIPFAVALTAVNVAGGILAGINWPFVAIIGGLALLKTAWDSDFMGVQTNLKNWWKNDGERIFTALQVFLATKLPEAIGVMTAKINALIPYLRDLSKVLDGIGQAYKYFTAGEPTDLMKSGQGMFGFEKGGPFSLSPSNRTWAESFSEWFKGAGLMPADLLKGRLLRFIESWRFVTGYQSGGIFNQATPGIIGENGPEALIPLNNTRRAMQILAASMSKEYALGRQMMPIAAMQSAPAGRQTTYMLNATTAAPMSSVVQGFAMMRAMGV